MAGYSHSGNGTVGRRRLAAAGMAIVMLVALTAVAIAYGPSDDDDRRGLAMTAVGQGPGMEVPADLPSPEEILAAVQAAQGASGGPVPQVDAPGISSSDPAMADPPISAPALPPLAGFPSAEPEPGTEQAVTIVNDYPGPVVLKLNGQSYDLAAGERVDPLRSSSPPTATTSSRWP